MTWDRYQDRRRCQGRGRDRASDVAWDAAAPAKLRRAPGPKHYYRLAWTCPLNGQIEGGIDRCVGRDVFPDWLVELIVVWAGSFILIGLWNRSLRGLTSSIPDRYVDQVPGSFQGRICDVELVPGSVQGRICDVELVPGSFRDL